MSLSRTTYNERHAQPVIPPRVALVYGLIVLVAAAFWPASVVLWRYWTDLVNVDGTHGPLLLAAIFWLIFRLRYRFSRLEVAPSPGALGALVVCAFAWLVFNRAGLEDLHLILLPLLVWLAVFAAFGRQVALDLLLAPLGLLYLALPVWSHLATPLQLMTTHVVGTLSNASGIPAYIEGNHVQIAAGVFEIAEGCSGVHFLVVGWIVAILYGELAEAPFWRRVRLTLGMTALALIANWVRVYVIVLMGHLTNMQTRLITHSHYWFGWGVFAVAAVIFVWIAGRTDPPPSPVAAVSSPPPMPAAVNRRYLVAVVVALAAIPSIALVVDLLRPVPPVPQSVPLVGVAGGWSGPTEDMRWHPQFSGTHAQRLALYRDARGESVEVVAILYPSQRQGEELVSEDNSLVGDGWQVMEEHPVASGGYREMIATDRNGERALIWFVYDIGGKQFTAPLASQLWYGFRSLGGAPTSVLLAIRAQCDSSCDSARSRLADFWEANSRPLLTGAEAWRARDVTASV